MPMRHARVLGTAATRQMDSLSNGRELRGGHGAVRARGTNSTSRRALRLSAEGSTGAAAPSKKKPLKVLIAGGGIGGLSLALGCKNKGMDVQVFERVKEYKPFGGPIQLQCNAMGTIEAIDLGLANRIYDNCTVTGDRINGLLDGIKGSWFFRFDTRQPCYKNGLPLTLVINRSKLLEVMCTSVGEELINTAAEVVDYREEDDGVVAILSDGTEVKGDVLVGADGIRSKVRQAMHPKEKSPLAYSGYTVYTATCKFTGKYTDTSKIGYQVYLGNKKYFVASDVGDGEQQWYAFHLVDADGVDEKPSKEVLLELFKDWNPAMYERLECTRQEDIERRDVYDVIPSISPFKWTKGRVVLIGDAIHAVQPNLGQGGGQAIESAYTLAAELERCASGGKADVQKSLFNFALSRVLRAGAVHGFSRSLGYLNIVYRRTLGSYPYTFYPERVKQFFNQVAKLEIPHPGRVIGQLAMMGSMSGILEYIGSGFNIPQKLGGAPITLANARGERALVCGVPGIGAPKRPLDDEDFKMKGIPGFADK